MKINCNFSGQNNGNAKLTPMDVQQIRHLYAKGGYTYQVLADMADVSKAHIYRIIKGISWATADDSL